jgi:hypothetical protein
VGPSPSSESWQLCAVIVVGAAGMLLNQLTSQAGPLTASLPAMSTVDPLLSIAIGVIVYDERMRGGLAAELGLAVRLLLLGGAVIKLTRTAASARAATPSVR